MKIAAECRDFEMSEKAREAAGSIKLGVERSATPGT